MMYKQLQRMEYATAGALDNLEKEVESSILAWTDDDWSVEPVGAPSYLEHIGFIQALAVYQWVPADESRGGAQ